LAVHPPCAPYFLPSAGNIQFSRSLELRACECLALLELHFALEKTIAKNRRKKRACQRLAKQIGPVRFRSVFPMISLTLKEDLLRIHIKIFNSNQTRRVCKEWSEPQHLQTKRRHVVSLTLRFVLDLFSTLPTIAFDVFWTLQAEVDVVWLLGFALPLTRRVRFAQRLTS
jgi:hypothetical protein